MITFRCTQKLLKELQLSKDELGEPQVGFLGSWFAHLFRLERRKCVIFTNDRTLYTVLLFDLKKRDFEFLGERFISGLIENLKRDEFPSEKIASIAIACYPVSWGATNNRSVLGSMNDMVRLSKESVSFERLETADEITGLNHFLNRTPMSILKLVRPLNEMKAAVNEWSP